MENISKKALVSLLSVVLLLGAVLLPNVVWIYAADAASQFVNELTLTDTDADNKGTLAKYDLLKDPTKGIEMEAGDTYVFDMDIRAKGYYAVHGGAIAPFGLDLLGNPTKSDNGGEVKLSGVEFVNKNAKYWIENGNWSELVGGKSFTHWAGLNNCYHYRFTVKAYESIRVEVNYSEGYNAEKLEYDGTIDWNKIYGLSNCKAGDGKLFYPNMAFLDQDGKVSNITVQYSAGETDTADTVKQITLTDTDAANLGTLAKYDLLKDPSKGIEMKSGDTYVFDMDIMGKSYDPVQGGTIRAFGFDLLGNPTKSDSGTEVKLAGVEFFNNYAMYWLTDGTQRAYMDPSQRFTIWAGASNYYHYRFTVKAYESIRVEFCYSEGYNAEKKQFDATVDWDKIYGLSNCKDGDGTLFYPNLAFLDQNGEVRNITMQRSAGKTDTVDTVKQITLTDTDPENNGTLAKYDLLADPTKGLAMDVGDIYVFDMDIRAKGYYAVHGGSITPFGLDLLGNPTKSDNGGEVKLSGVEFVNKNAKYWIENGNWSELVGGKSFTHWAGLNNCYHYRFTVKAYESIRVEVNYSEGYNAEKLEYDGTIDWNKIYGLSNCKPGDGKLFYPNMAFLDQDGEITNIQCTYTRQTKAPKIGENDKDLAKDRALPTDFDGNEDTIFDLGRVVTTTEEVFWNYSVAFRYDRFGGEYSGLEAIFAEGMYGGKRQNLMLSAKAHTQGDTVADTQLVLRAGTDGTVLHETTLPAVYATGEEYTLTVQLSGSKVSFWINDDILLENFDLTEAGVTDLAPQFGFNADGTAGTVSAIHVWGDLDLSTVPEMGADDTDMIGDRKVPTQFSGHTNMTLDLGKIVTANENASWTFSGKFTYTQLAEGYSGLNITFADCLYKGARKDLVVTARARKVDGQVIGTQVVLWPGINSDPLYLVGNGSIYRTDREYTFTVRLQDGKVSFWIDHTLLVDEFDLTAKGVTALRPRFALCGNGSAGTLSDLHAWGDIVRVLPATRPAAAVNLLQNCEEFLSFTPTIRSSYYDNNRIQVQGDTWYYSGSYVYSSMATYGGITPIFAEATYAMPAGKNTAAITGTRELSVTARSGGFEGETRRTQSVIWADNEPILVSSVSGLSLEIGKKYTFTVEMKNGLLTFWLDNTLVFNDVDLSAYGITNIRPKFGILPDGSSGTLSDVQVWDTVTTDQKPVYTDKDINNAVLSSVKVSAALGRLLYDGISYTDDGEYYYAATVKGNGARLIAAKNGEATVETYYDGKTAYLVSRKGADDTVLAKAAVDADVSNGCVYTVKYSAGLVSVWVNDVLVLSKIAVDGFVPTAGVAAEKDATGEVTDILLWGDVSKNGGTVYQSFGDISAYRTGKKTYPTANGYVFGGWYQTANEEKPVSDSTVSGAAYAKMVPASVLSVETKTQKDITYASDKTDLRFVTTVDSLSYQSIGIRLTCGGKTQTFVGKDVYKAIGTADNEEKWSSPKMAFGSDSLYYFTVKVKNVNRPNAVWTATPFWTTPDGTEVVGVTTEVAVNDKFGKRVAEEQLDLNGSTLLQVTAGKANTMAYVIRTGDGKTVVIDGGTKEDAAYLVWLLKNRYGVSAVDAWYITHEDADHYGALEDVLDSGSLTVNKVYYNFQEGSTGEFNAKLKAAANAEVIGRVTHTYGDVTVRAINDHREYAAAANTADKATTVLLAEFGGNKNTGVLFLGDLTKETEAYVLKQAQDAGIDMTGRVVQLANHGSSSCSRAFYEQLQPKACLWPCVRSTWENNAELRTFLYGVGAQAQYSSVSENIEFR